MKILWCIWESWCIIIKWTKHIDNMKYCSLKNPFFFKMKRWLYLISEACYQKLRTLSFLQLLKFEKAKCPYFFYLWPRSRDIANFFNWRSWCKVQAIVSGRNCQYLGSLATNKKSETLLPQPLKVEEKKVTLVFLICGPGAEIWPLYHFSCISLWCDPLKKGDAR